jgi:hypothetical protein
MYTIVLCSILLFIYAPLTAKGATYSTIPPAPGYADGTRTTFPASTIVFPESSDNAFLRPSAGERLTAGSTYTVRWANPAGDIMNMEVTGDGARAFGNGSTCLGWIINYDCGPLGLNLPNTGEFVWDIGDSSGAYGYEEVSQIRMWFNGRSNVRCRLACLLMEGTTADHSDTGVQS